MTENMKNNEEESPDGRATRGPRAADAGARDAAEKSEAGVSEENAAGSILTSDYQTLKADRDALFDRLARATAEFKNSQRRLQQDLEQRTQYANSTLIKALLPVIDNFERALAVDPAKADIATVLKGLQIVHDQLMKVLKHHQVEEIAPPPGTPYDHSQHEALIQQDSTYTSPTVVQLLQKGYALHGRTLRPAQVAVSKSA